MLSRRQNVIHEINIIPINYNSSKPIKINSPKSEVGLKQNFFDPSKSSPPNLFMIKLHMRANQYHVDNNDDSLDIE